MRKGFTNKLNMYKKLLGILKNESNILLESPLFAESVNEFDNLVNRIMESGTISERGSSPATIAKEVARKKLAEEAATMAAILMAFAYDSKDLDLQARANLSFTKIFYVRYTETTLRAKQIEDLLQQYKAQLEPYMLDEKRFSRLGKLLRKYEELSIKAGGVKAGVVASNIEIARLIKETDTFLKKKLDNLVYVLKSKHPDFYVKYRNARQIIDL